MVTDARTPNRNYPEPASGNTVEEDFLRLIQLARAVDLDVAGLLASLATKAALVHGHGLDEIAGLVSALAGKAPLLHAHGLDDLTDVETAGAAPGQPLIRGASGWQPGSIDASWLSGTIAAARLPASVLGALRYQGTWNATTNSPAIPAASADNKGWYYRVAVAGTTAIDGIADWGTADWVVSNGTSWEKIDNSETPLPTVLAGLAALPIGANGTFLRVAAGALAYVAAATAANYRANTDGPLTVAAVWAAAAPVALVDAATIALDLSSGINFSLSLGANRVLGAPTGAKPGQSGHIWLTHSGAGRTLDTRSAGIYKTPGGLELVLSTTAGAVDRVTYCVQAADRIDLDVSRGRA